MARKNNLFKAFRLNNYESRNGLNMHNFAQDIFNFHPTVHIERVDKADWEFTQLQI